MEGARMTKYRQTEQNRQQKQRKIKPTQIWTQLQLNHALCLTDWTRADWSFAALPDWWWLWKNMSPSVASSHFFWVADPYGKQKWCQLWRNPEHSQEYNLHKNCFGPVRLVLQNKYSAFILFYTNWHLYLKFWISLSWFRALNARSLPDSF